ncbi:hypothetical protein ACFYW6_12400 [Streptomyces sp. NPDC002659]|uniref:hypothetical protein n=1 Tax=Streptomyces sp. NPDC002659 TaxID=3364656 RepID=UPI0036B5C5A9
MASRAHRPLISGVIGSVIALVGIPLAFADDSPAPQPGDTPSVAVEDFSYPDAANILATKGIKLKKGDGRILLADCDPSADQIRVMTVKEESAGREGMYCFRATAKTGFLTLELPRVFALEAADHPISAEVTANGQTTTVDVAKGGFESVGEGVPGGARSVLVEIRVTG